MNNINKLNQQRSLVDKIRELTESSVIGNIKNDIFDVCQFNKKYNDKYNFSLLHVNIHSLNSKLVEFCEFVASFSMRFDVIVLSEVWSTNLEFYGNILPGYRLYYNLPTDTRVGGVAMYISNEFMCTRCDQLELVSTEDCKVESLWFKLQRNNEQFYIGGIYRHPGGYVDEFIKRFDSTISNMSTRIPVFIAGDFNINLLDFDANSKINKYLDSVLMNNIFPVLYTPTRITQNSSTLIDHIYFREPAVSSTNYEIFSGNIEDDLSDHLPNFCLFKNFANSPGVSARQNIRVFNKRNKINFTSKISNVDWNSLFIDSNDIDFCYNAFTTKLNSIFEESFPLTPISRKAQKNKPWFTPALGKSRQKNLALYKKWIKTKNEADHQTY